MLGIPRVRKTWPCGFPVGGTLRDESDNANTAIDDNERRPYQRLSEEAKDRVRRAVVQDTRAGNSSPRLDDSLLGLDWSLFHPRNFPGQEEDLTLRTPLEFTIYASSALDAYVTALLDADPPKRPGGTIDCTCSLRQDKAGSLTMHLKTDSCQMNTGWWLVMMNLLNSFPKLLQARGIKAGEIAYLREGNHVRFTYPGQMVVSCCPYLCDRPLDLWPSVTLVLTITDELVERAQKVSELLRSDGAGGGVVH